MPEGAPVTQWLLRCTGGLHRIHAVDLAKSREHSDRRIEHALNPVTHATGSAHVRTEYPLRGPPREHTRPGVRDGRRPLGGLQLRPGSRGPPLVRLLVRRRDGHRPRSRRRHRRLPYPPAPVGTRRGTPARRGTGAPPWPPSQERQRGAPRRSSHWGKYTGRLTGFSARVRLFSANFWIPHTPWADHPPTPVPPARIGVPGPCAPYGDWPLRQGALPCTAHECNAS